MPASGHQQDPERHHLELTEPRSFTKYTKTQNNLKMTPKGGKDHESSKAQRLQPEDEHSQQRGKKLWKVTLEKESLPKEAGEVEDDHREKRQPGTTLEETKGSGQSKHTFTGQDREGEEEQVEPASDQGGQSSRWHGREGQVILFKIKQEVMRPQLQCMLALDAEALGYCKKTTDT